MLSLDWDTFRIVKLEETPEIFVLVLGKLMLKRSIPQKKNLVSNYQK